ncbi:ATP-binding protein [Rhodopseudomonas palustris]|uniref:ATP-binding protein n=1 Tax=Rhodopseudomonas palustris TaxID=1076 RepID=UPI002ACDFAFB|nr:ATP-binding protein [Rhodopseudomonas palustris]WQH01939.1 ATP-binding protein [Rhodopseudomonas palustris]
MANDVTALQVADEDFLVASLIERCPKTMMVRELMMNALEAAQHAAYGRRFVEISAVSWGGCNKLAIWNTGLGMDDHELQKISNIASSLGKQKSLTGNFGMGAKVASLPSNQLGMRYRSCKGGRVHEVILCKRDGVYGRLRRRDNETGAFVEVVEVTDLVEQEGRSLNQDWTEVLLLGNKELQDTVKDPYDGDPDQDAQWLATYLYHRFYRLPDGVKVTLLKGTHKLDGNRQFEPIPDRLRHFEKNETVLLASGIKIHYLYDAQYNSTGHNRSISGAIASAVSTCAVVYKNEMYDLAKGRQWTFEAPVFGIPFGAKHISVHVELPEGFPVVPEAYRQFLQYLTGEQSRLQAKDFAEVVRESRPQWLIELIHSFAPDSQNNEQIRDELQRLLNQLRVRRISPKVSSDGAINVAQAAGAASEPNGGGSEGKGGAGSRQRPTDLSVIPEGAKRADMFRNLERAPEIIPLNTDEEIEEKGLKSRAARYVMEAGQLFVNMKYPAIDEMRAQLEIEYADANEVDVMRSLAQRHAQDSMILRVGRTVVYALAKQINKEWDQKALEIASSPESLSMAADNYFDSMQNVRRAIGKALRTSRSEVDAA